MDLSTVYDVIAIGAGPAGSAAAKRCAELGLSTLILERYRLPRKKVCDGELNPRTQEIVVQEFGEIPESLLSDPPSLDGLVFHMPDGSPPATYEFSLPSIWRYRLDHWMCQVAIEKGAEIWEAARVVSLERENEGYAVTYSQGKTDHQVACRFVIGADGCASTVRRSLFPDLKLKVYYQAQERFAGGHDLDRRYIHEFINFPGFKGYTMTDTYHKDDLCMMGYLADRRGQINALKEAMHTMLAEKYGFDPDQKPVWAKGCVEPLFADDLVSYRFRPAKGNAVLAGDAAGLMFPATLEGIGPALRSGLLAGEACREAAETGREVSDIYLDRIEPLVALARKALQYENRIMAAIAAKDYRKVARLRDSVPFNEIYTDF